MPMTVGLAGASGFVGTHLIEALASDFRVRALSRSANVVATLSSGSGCRVAALRSLFGAKGHGGVAGLRLCDLSCPLDGPFEPAGSG